MIKPIDKNETLKKMLYKRTGANPAKFIDGGKRLAEEAKGYREIKRKDCSRDVGHMVKDAVRHMCKREFGSPNMFNGIGNGKRGVTGTYTVINGEIVKIKKNSLKRFTNKSYTKFF
jgi:hypothetical protein